MVFVLPKSQLAENRIRTFNPAVAVSTIRESIVGGKCDKSIGCIRRRLWRNVAEEFGAIVNRAVAVAIERQKSISRIRGSPGNGQRPPSFSMLKTTPPAASVIPNPL